MYGRIPPHIMQLMMQRMRDQGRAGSGQHIPQGMGGGQMIMNRMLPQQSPPIMPQTPGLMPTQPGIQPGVQPGMVPGAQAQMPQYKASPSVGQMPAFGQMQFGKMPQSY